MSPSDDYLRVWKRDNKDIYLLLGWSNPDTNYVGVVVWVLRYPYEKDKWICLLDSKIYSQYHHIYLMKPMPEVIQGPLKIRYEIRGFNHDYGTVQCYENPDNPYAPWTQKDVKW